MDHTVRSAKPVLRVSSIRRSWVPALLIFGAFTPYLGLSLDIRWEHLLAYGSIILIAANGRLAASRTLSAAGPVLVPWLILAALVLVSTTLRLTSATSSFPAVQLLAILDSFLLPVALVLVAGAYASGNPGQWQRQVRRAVGLIVTLVSINALLIILFPVEQVDWFVRQFWANPTTTGPRVAVADRALRGGRYGGIFNQPFDGGLAYALSLMGWLYLFVLSSRSTVRRSLTGVTSLALIIAGGISTGSKVFIFGTVLVVAATVLPSRGAKRSRLERLTRVVAIGSLGLLAVSVTESAVFDRYLRVLGAVGSDVATVSGGRWNSFGEYLNRLLSNVSLYGTGWQGPQDDALLSYLRGGGIIGVLTFIGVFRALILLSTRLPKPANERALLIGMTVVMLAASFGAISLQANRASSIYWILVGLTIGHMAKHRRMRQKQVD
jgi:hypothetical protein